MTMDKAVATVKENFDLLDTAAGIGGKDGLIGVADLKAITKTPAAPSHLKEAAQFLLNNPAYRNQLDVAAGIGKVDGLIGKCDVDAYQKDHSPRRKQYAQIHCQNPVPNRSSMGRPVANRELIQQLNAATLAAHQGAHQSPASNATPTNQCGNGASTQQPTLAPQQAQVNSASNVGEWSFKRKYYDSSSYSKFNDFFKRAGDDLSNGKLAGLSKPQEAALLEQMKETGLTLNFRCRDTDKIDDTYKKSYTFKPRPGETMKQFVNRAMADGGSDFKAYVKSEEGAINIKDLSVNANFPQAGSAPAATTGGVKQPGKSKVQAVNSLAEAIKANFEAAANAAGNAAGATGSSAIQGGPMTMQSAAEVLKKNWNLVGTGKNKTASKDRLKEIVASGWASPQLKQACNFMLNSKGAFRAVADSFNEKTIGNLGREISLGDLNTITSPGFAG